MESVFKDPIGNQNLANLNDSLPEIAPIKEDLQFSQRFYVRELLGTGAYGVVLLVKKTSENGDKSALKIINKAHLSERALTVMHNEALALNKLKHPSVVGFKNIYET
jgi:hypothetical protein